MTTGPATSTTTIASTTTGGSQVSCVERVLAGMSTAQRAGQVVMAGAKQPKAAQLAPAVRRYHLGGAFLAERWSISVGALRRQTDQLQAAATVPLLVAVDQEGGHVQGLSGDGFSPIPSALEQGRWPPGTLRSSTAAWGRQLRRAGVRMNLAPVADVVPAASAADNPPIGAIDRQYGGDPNAVAGDVVGVVTAMQGAGVLATVKHFPGLGRVRANTDRSAAAVDGVMTDHDPYLAPFAAAADAKVAAVMISSARYPRLDAHSIAAFSTPIITGLLRDKLGFTGVVISDDLGQADAVANYPPGDRAVRFLSAGGDLVLTVLVTDAGPMTGAILAEAGKSPAFARRLETAARRVLTAKDRLGLLSC